MSWEHGSFLVPAYVQCLASQQEATHRGQHSCCGGTLFA